MKAAILLSGCGFYDGTEIAEAVLAALHLERAGHRVVYVAPGGPQMHTVDHRSGSESEEGGREIDAESARLARGRIRTIEEQFAGELGCLVIPGGHGAVKNLTTNFATLGAPRELLPEVKGLLADLSGRGAPIGSISLGRTVVQTFLGEALSEEDMSTPATDVVVDAARRLAYTPGFLTGTSLDEVSTGIEKLVGAIQRMSGGLNIIH